MDRNNRNYSPIDKNTIEAKYRRRLNPLEGGDSLYKQEEGPSPSIDNLRDSEINAAGPTDTSNPDSVREQEESGYANKFTGSSAKKSGGSGIQGFVKSNKKRGPAALLIGAIVAIILAIASVTPGFLLIHVAETITDKFNMQYASLDIRTNRVLSKKLSGRATQGMCGSVVSVKCRFSSVNDRQLERLRAAGFTVNTEGTTITGRHRVVGMSLDNQNIRPQDLPGELRRNPIMRSRFRQAYDPLFGGFADKVHQKVAQRMGFSKRPLFGPNFDANMSEADRNQRLKDYSNEGTRGTADDGRFRFTRVEEPADSSKPFCNSLGECLSESDANERNAAGNAAGSIDNASRSTAESGEKSTRRLIQRAQRGLDLKNPVRALGVTQVPDSLCSLYSAYRAVSIGAKTIRTVKMARFAYQFLNIASMIKAGDATPEDVSYFAGILTKTVTEEIADENGKMVEITTKAATDSYGFRYAAYGDTGPLTPSAAEFLAGSGFGGDVSGIAGFLMSQLGSNKKQIAEKCKFVKNPFTQGINLVVGIALIAAGPGGWIAKGLTASVSGGIMIAIEKAADLTIPVLADIAAGVVIDDNTFGEAAGDALVSGSGAMMSSLAAAGGNAPLKPEQAVAYMGHQSNSIALYAEEERLARGHFDTSSRHTFAGRILAQLVPYSSQSANIASLTTTSLSVAKRSMASIISPSVFAADNTPETYTQCDDTDYRELGLATDPFCNPIRGIPSQYLDADPVEIIDRLIANGSIDEESGAPKPDSDYEEFISNCVDREMPLGYEDDDFQGSDGKECFLDNDDFANRQTKADWYVYHIDSRIVDTMENGYNVETGRSSGGGGARISEAELRALIKEYGLPDPTAEGADGWEQKLSQLTDNPKASWAAESLLAAEKNFMDRGGDLKEYLTTAWIWFENGGSAWPDPYQINCDDNRGFNHEVSELCTPHNNVNLQVSGYRPVEKQDKYMEIYDMFYTESELPSILEKVLSNSHNARLEKWNYNDPDQRGKGLVKDHLRDISGATTSQITPNATDFFDPETQFLTLMLGKDPNMTIGMNSFAVSDHDLLAHIGEGEGCGPGWGSYICKPERQLLSNMIYALWKYDSQFGGPSGGSGSGAVTLETKDGKTYARSGIWGGKSMVVSQPNNYTGDWVQKNAKMYAYSIPLVGYLAHPGTDIAMDVGTQLFSPVDGEVVIAGDSGYYLHDGGTGGELRIKRDNGDLVILGHMSKITVKVGQRVTVGQPVGESGTAGSGPHLHLEYRTHRPDGSEKSVDPVEYL